MLNQRTMMTHVSFIGECNRMHPCGSRLCYGRHVCVLLNVHVLIR